MRIRKCRLIRRQLDTAMTSAYGCADYSASMPDEEILQRLLKLNLERALFSPPRDTKK